MGLFEKFKAGLQKTHSKLSHEIRRIVTRSPRLGVEALEELEAALISADLGIGTTEQILETVKKSYETQGAEGSDVLKVAEQAVEAALGDAPAGLLRASNGPTIVSIVGVNGTGK